jgi:hypothetical protein
MDIRNPHILPALQVQLPVLEYESLDSFTGNESFVFSDFLLPMFTCQILIVQPQDLKMLLDIT